MKQIVVISGKGGTGKTVIAGAFAALAKNKVMADAERMAEGMIEAARVAAEQEVRKAKSTLKNESVELAMGLAEALIREKIDADDHKRIVQDYLAKVEGMK